MKKFQLQEKVQKHVDELFLNLSQNLGIDVSENVKTRFYQSLYNEAVASFQKQLRETVTKETENMFSGLETDLGLSFKEQTKKNLLATLLIEAFEAEKSNSSENEAKKAEVNADAFDEKEVQQVIPQEVDTVAEEAEVEKADVNDAGQEENQITSQEVETVAEVAEVEKTEINEDALEEQEENQAASQENETISGVTKDTPSLVQDPLKVKAISGIMVSLQQNSERKAAKKSKPRKYWTEQCDDPDIINRVNKIIRDKLDFSDSLTRDSSLRNDIGADSLDHVEIIMEFEKVFDISVPDDIASTVHTVGDAYDAVLYFLEQKKRC